MPHACHDSYIRTDVGTGWQPQGHAKAVIPDRNYAGVYQAAIDFCRNGSFDVTTMGNVANVGLMAKKAEEYGSHDKTLKSNPPARYKWSIHRVRFYFRTMWKPGIFWRMCQTKKVSIIDWVKLAVNRARLLAVAQLSFGWMKTVLTTANLIKYVNAKLTTLETDGLDIQILAPIDATKLTCQRCKDGLDTISATGNVLRDYLTDLFPILELGTSAKKCFRSSTCLPEAGSSKQCGRICP